MIEQLMISVLSVGIGILGTLIVIKLQFGNDRILEYVDVVLDGVTQDTEIQKKLYLVGVLVGNGIKSGVGLTKGRGKFGMEDLVGMGLQHFFGWGKESGQTPQQPSTTKTINDL